MSGRIDCAHAVLVVSDRVGDSGCRQVECSVWTMQFCQWFLPNWYVW